MKKLLLLAALFFIVASGLFAQMDIPETYFGASFIRHEHSLESNGSDRPIVIMGPGIHFASSFDGPISFYSRMDLGWAMFFTTDSSSVDLNDYDLRIMGDFLFGLDFELMGGKGNGVDVALGLSIMADILQPNDLQNASTISIYTLGPGADLVLSSDLLGSLGFYISGSISYQMLAVVDGYDSINNDPFDYGLAFAVSGGFRF